MVYPECFSMRKKTTTIQALERGLVILDIIGKAGRPLLLNEIAEHFSIDRSSFFRLIGTLAQNGFVIQDPETKRYTIGYRILELSGCLSNQGYIENLIRPIMRRIVAATGQHTHLAVLDRNEVVFIAVEQPHDPLTLNITVGTREPAAVTALGKSLLAFTEPAELDQILAKTRFVPYTAKTTNSASELKKDLESVRTNRVAIDDEEYRPGIVCFAAPVFDYRNQACFSIGISGLRDAIQPHSKAYCDVVMQAGAEASTLMGHTRK
jgi:IclR family transcriptional regulator, KDG regulon repressor